MITSTELLEKIEAFLLLHGMSATAFGVNVMNDRKLVAHMRTGRVPNMNNAHAISKYMSDYAEGSAPDV